MSLRTPAAGQTDRGADMERDGTSNGPSPDEWHRHKNLIIDMYQDQEMPLKEVIHIMKHRYQFRATKRMYDTRFRKWGVSKILKSSEKESIAKALALGEPRHRSSEAALISHKDWRKIMRWVSSQARGQQASANPGEQQRDQPLSSGVLDGASLGEPRWKTAGQGTQFWNEQPTQELSLTPPAFVGDVHSVGPDSAHSSDFSDLTPATSQTILTPSSIRSGRHSERISSTSPAPTLILSPMSRNHECVLHNVKAYFSSRIESLTYSLELINVLDIGSSPETRRFWSNVKNGIYLWKIAGSFPDTLSRGFTALNEANALAGAALSTEPFDFLREVLATLSPTNTKIHPPLRRHLLLNLNREAVKLFGSSHPIAVICSSLQGDGDDPMVSRIALQLMLDIVSQSLGHSHPVWDTLMTTLIKMMRRAGELEGAKKFAGNALKLARDDFGVDSNQARTAAVELAHVLTKLGAHGHALPLRLDVVQAVPSSTGATRIAYREDGIAVHAMEDISEFYIRFGCPQEAVLWLRRAHSIALMLWGNCVATAHIEDKLQRLLVGCQQGLVDDGD
ncbi:hypothetical protein LTR37_002393 [Vermiconidia calcicola]|uniref:Uncharacterized protein n=1 Tax=Vermiconidia calcicola TaxID=1690605 RepID=A0ACC3NVD4_9PEZI|nr:hypothetical protein LTR37_002393 [Vermiconidia calcicola]